MRLGLVASSPLISTSALGLISTSTLGLISPPTLGLIAAPTLGLIAASPLTALISAATTTPTEELYIGGNDFSGVMGLALLFIGSGLEAALHIDLPSLGKVSFAVLSHFAEHGNAVPFGFFLALPGVFIGPLLTGGHGQLYNGHSLLGVPDFRITPQISHDDCFINTCHKRLLCVEDGYLRLSSEFVHESVCPVKPWGDGATLWIPFLIMGLKWFTWRCGCAIGESMKTTALEKRIKRRITARHHFFFAVCAPGLKRLCCREMAAVLPHLETVEMIPGGVLFSGTMQDCYTANLHLRSPSRITLRVARFKAENFRTLEKKIKAVEWELYLINGMPLSCEVVTRHCRLYHTDAVARCVTSGIHDYFDALPPDRSSMVPWSGEEISQSLLVRGQDDMFEISLDSSGEGLYKRGIKTHGGVAPLRETLAFALLEAAGFTPGMPLVDGMCGSGTFALEAALITRHMAPGLFRSFAFEGWPSFRPAQWRFLKTRAAEKTVPPDRVTVFASDVDAAGLVALERAVAAADLSGTIAVAQKDFFDLTSPVSPGETLGVVALNPPYGRRIGNTCDIGPLFRRIGEKLSRDFKGWTAVVIMPDRALAASFPFSCRFIKLFHGGLDLHVAIGRV